MNPESVDVTAGLGGFLAFFLLAVALYFLMRNMNTRLRRLSYREAQEGKAADDGSPPDHHDPPDSPDPKGGPPDDPDLG
jgi:hypothetical protein